MPAHIILYVSRFCASLSSSASKEHNYSLSTQKLWLIKIMTLNNYFETTSRPAPLSTNSISAHELLMSLNPRRLAFRRVPQHQNVVSLPLRTPPPPQAPAAGSIQARGAVLAAIVFTKSFPVNNLAMLKPWTLPLRRRVDAWALMLFNVVARRCRCCRARA